MASKIFQGIPNVIRGKDEEVPVSNLDGEGKVLGLYFSAHWCPPCRGFTPKLAEWYKTLKEGPLKEKLEIVFISSDRTEEAFKEYFNEMPWLALPFERREEKQSLSAKYKISGIPTLLFFDANTGELINKKGRGVVSDDPKGEKFPWKEPTLRDVLSSKKYVNNSGEEKSFSDFEGKPLAIYFSAHWCPPCRGFTPTLAKFYKNNAQGKFELIFVSGDRSEADFDEYMKEMPWYAVPFTDSKLRDELNDHFEVEGIPHLIILDENLKVITDNGRSMVEKDPEAKEFPWHPKPLDSLHGGTAKFINEYPCLLYVTGGVAENIEKAKEQMKPIAEEYCEKNKDKDDAIKFLYTDGDSLDDKLLSFINITGPFPKLCLINIPKGKKYMNEEETIDVADFLKKYEEGKLTSKGLRE